MRSTWKGTPLGWDHPVGHPRMVPWAYTVGATVVLYNGRRWRSTRVRPPFVGRTYSYHLWSRPVGRPIRAKFAAKKKKTRR
jgi:ribosomal protein S19